MTLVFMPEHTIDLTRDPMDEVFDIQTHYDRLRYEEVQRHSLAMSNIELDYTRAMYRFNLDVDVRYQILTSLRMIYAPLP